VIHQLDVIVGGKCSRSISPLLPCSCENLFIYYCYWFFFKQQPSSVSGLRTAGVTFVLMMQWVSAAPHLPCETWGNTGHWCLCYNYRDSTGNWTLSSLHACNRSADRNELFENWHQVLPVIFRIHHFILAGICFTVGKYFQSHLPLKNVRYFQKQQRTNQLILSQLLKQISNTRPASLETRSLPRSSWASKNPEVQWRHGWSSL